MHYEYFVSYVRSGAAGGFSLCDGTVKRSAPMDAAGIQDTRAAFAELHPGEQIAILSFQQLHTPALTATV